MSGRSFRVFVIMREGAPGPGEAPVSRSAACSFFLAVYHPRQPSGRPRYERWSHHILVKVPASTGRGPTTAGKRCSSRTTHLQSVPLLVQTAALPLLRPAGPSWELCLGMKKEEVVSDLIRTRISAPRNRRKEVLLDGPFGLCFCERGFNRRGDSSQCFPGSIQ